MTKFITLLCLIYILEFTKLDAMGAISSSSDEQDVTISDTDTVSEEYSSIADVSGSSTEEYSSSTDVSGSSTDEYSSSTEESGSSTDEYSSSTEESVSSSSNERSSSELSSKLREEIKDPINCEEKVCDCNRNRNIFDAPKYEPADYRAVEYTSITGSIALLLIFTMHILYEYNFVSNKTTKTRFTKVPVRDGESIFSL